MPKLETTMIEEAITEHFGRRCKTTDAEDFPELAGKIEGRCPVCLAWKQYDALLNLAKAAPGTASDQS